jgi:hypothetical protein
MVAHPLLLIQDEATRGGLIRHVNVTPHGGDGRVHPVDLDGLGKRVLHLHLSGQCPDAVMRGRDHERQRSRLRAVAQAAAHLDAIPGIIRSRRITSGSRACTNASPSTALVTPSRSSSRGHLHKRADSGVMITKQDTSLWMILSAQGLAPPPSSGRCTFQSVQVCHSRLSFSARLRPA